MGKERHMEEELRQRDRQLEVIMSSIAGGLKISHDDDTYSFAFVSKEAAALFGYTVEEFMEASGGSAVGAVYPPDLPRVLGECVEAFKDGGLTYAIRYRVRCKDGSLKWVIDSGKKAQDADGRWMVNSLYLDITRSEEDAQRLREQTGLLTSIYDTVPCGIIRFVERKNGDYHLISLNSATLSLMGYKSLEEGLADWYKGVLGAVVEEDKHLIRDGYDRLHKVGDRQDMEYRVQWKDGSIHWMDGTSMIVGMTEDDEPVIQRTVIDITPRKVLKQRLDREQELYRIAMEVSAAVMFEYLMDSDTFISYEPRTGEGILKNELKDYRKVLAEGQIVHPDDVPVVIDNICNGRSEVFEVRLKPPTEEPGVFVWYRANCRLIMEAGKPARVVGALYNIHSMKSKLSENKERLCMSKSALEEAYESLKHANEAKSEFLSRMSHDIRTPMNAILGMTAIAQSHLDDRKKVEDCLDKISLSGTHLLELINEVLDMSKIESGNVSLSEDAMKLTDLLDDVVQIVRTDVDARRQHISLNIKKQEHNAVYGDAVRLKQILLNLLSNAVKYTGEGGNITISMDEKFSSETGVGCFEFVVEDNGIGMTREFLDKLFLPFERAEDSRVSQIQGTGLGLAITRNLVQMMNGTIQVESELNRGTRFIVTVYLKLAVEEEKETEEDKNLPERWIFAPETRILLAEDNQLNQEIVKELLSMYGVEIVCAEDGQKAVDLFRQNPPGTFGVILMDIQMPVLDGYGAARAIRALGADGTRPDGARIPIIALTANAFADDAYRARQAGMNEHVTKPLEVGHLVDVLHQYLG